MATTTLAVGQREIPDAVLALGSLDRVDYVDSLTYTTDVTATPEQWARAAFGDVPTVGERLVWVGLLHMRLSPGRSPDTVAGWRIADRGPDWLRLEAESWFLSGNLVFHVTEHTVSLTTFLRYDRKYGNLVWPPLSAVHRRLAPGLLPDAERVLAGQ